MADQLQLRGGTTAEHSTFTGALREVTVDTDKDTVVVHDGSTAGGHPLAKQNLSNVPAGTITSTMIADGTIVNADINASAAIAGTKISPDFGSQTIQTTGVVSHALGTAAAPTLTFTGDTNTGIYSPGADQVAISTGGTGRLFVDASGNVGIGATPAAWASTAYALQVGGRGFINGSSNLTIVGNNYYDNGTNTIYIASAAASDYYQSGGEHVWRGAASGTAGNAVSFSERMRLTSTGLGVGTSAPPSILALNGTDPLITFQNAATNRWQLGYENTNSHRFVLYDTNAAAYRLVVDSSGRVGIGTSSPVDRLHVDGRIAVSTDSSTPTTGEAFFYKSATGAVMSGFGATIETGSAGSRQARVSVDSTGRVGIGTTSPIANLHVVNPTTTSEISLSGGTTAANYSQIGFYGGSTRNAEVSANSAFLTLTHQNSGVVRVETGGTERARIDSSGRLGIGTSAPDGNLTIGGLTGTAGQSADAINVNRTDGLRLFGVKWDVDSNEVRFSGNTKNYVFRNGSSEAETVRITSTGRLGIGTTSPSYALDVQGSQGVGLQIFENSSGNNRRLRITQESSGVTYDATYSLNGNTHRWLIGGGETMRLDANGRLLVGTSSSRTINGITGNLQLEGTTYNAATASLVANTADGNCPFFHLGKTRGTSSGSVTSVANGDYLGVISWYGADGTSLLEAGRIEARVDGTPGTNDMPGRLVFSTTADGASSPTERMRIDNTGYHQFYGINDTIVSRTNKAAGVSYATFLGVHSATGPNTGTLSSVIWSNGNVQNVNGSYTTLSDEKLKENIVDAGSQWDDLKAIRIRNWNFKAETGHETHRQIGPIAQELETVCPGLVFETPDRDEDGNETGEFTKGVNQSILYMKAVKALQEAMERIEQLEAEMAEVKAQLS